LLNTNSRITAHKNYRKRLMSIRCYLSLYNTHHPAEKLGLPDKSLNLMQSLNQWFIYHSWPAWKIWKKQKFFSCQN